MSAAARSILVYSIYVFGLGATLTLIPNVPLPIFGLAEATVARKKATNRLYFGLPAQLDQRGSGAANVV